MRIIFYIVFSFILLVTHVVSFYFGNKTAINNLGYLHDVEPNIKFEKMKDKNKKTFREGTLLHFKGSSLYLSKYPTSSSQILFFPNIKNQNAAVGIELYDANNNGIIEDVELYDNNRNHLYTFSIDEKTLQFKMMTYSNNHQNDDIMFFDFDLDGNFELKGSLSGRKEDSISPKKQWYPVKQDDNGDYYYKINGERKYFRYETDNGDMKIIMED